jgi:hypothetical protein
MPHIEKQKARKQRLKSAALPAKEPTVSAAVSIAEPLYLRALRAAKEGHEGNFSAYVRRLIRRDLNAA